MFHLVERVVDAGKAHLLEFRGFPLKKWHFVIPGLHNTISDENTMRIDVYQPASPSRKQNSPGRDPPNSVGPENPS